MASRKAPSTLRESTVTKVRKLDLSGNDTRPKGAKAREREAEREVGATHIDEAKERRGDHARERARPRGGVGSDAHTRARGRGEQSTRERERGREATHTRERDGAESRAREREKEAVSE